MSFQTFYPNLQTFLHGLIPDILQLWNKANSNNISENVDEPKTDDTVETNQKEISSKRQAAAGTGSGSGGSGEVGGLEAPPIKRSPGRPAGSPNKVSPQMDANEMLSLTFYWF